MGKSDSGRAPAAAALFVSGVQALGKSEAKPPELTIVGGARPKARKPSIRDWTKAKEEAFVSALAETCNVTAAAEVAGVSLGGAYARRKKVAAFRAAWAEAVATAYQRLELVLLERALNGTEKVVKRRDGSEEIMRDYPNSVAMTLLKMHRDHAMDAAAEQSEGDGEADGDEIRERLVQKLERLRKRFEVEGKD